MRLTVDFSFSFYISFTTMCNNNTLVCTHITHSYTQTHTARTHAHKVHYMKSEPVSKWKSGGSRGDSAHTEKTVNETAGNADPFIYWAVHHNLYTYIYIYESLLFLFALFTCFFQIYVYVIIVYIRLLAATRVFLLSKVFFFPPELIYNIVLYYIIWVYNMK